MYSRRVPLTGRCIIRRLSRRQKEMEERGTKGGEKRALCSQGAARTLRWRKNIGSPSKYEARHGLLSTFTACRRFTRERRRDEVSRVTRHRVSIVRFYWGAGKAPLGSFHAVTPAGSSTIRT